MSKDDLIVGLDIGTTKVVAMVARLGPEGYPEILGLGSAESSGLKKGVVVNIEATVKTISRVIQEVE
ncbi:MAG: cell division protein FtsA, partial [Rhodocyclales bacterium CG17_big_fil_post_rev_8_21_14_2_50_68_7]